jgi:hypothetical protein
MGKTSFVIVASMVALLFAAGAMLQSLVVLQRIAAVSNLTGDVKIKPSGADAYYPLADTRYVKSGDVIHTGQGSVTLNWVDGTRIRIGPSSTLKVLKCQFNSATNASLSLFRLDVGRVWVRVLKALNPRSKFEVATPTATAGVRGTIFGVTVDKLGHTQVDVIEGQVAVRVGDQDVLVEKNEVARVSLSSMPRRIETAPASQVGAKGLELATMCQKDFDTWSQNSDIMGPYVAVLRPAEGVVEVSDGGVVVEGIAEVSADVLVNGKLAERGPKGKFRVVLPAPSGTQLRLKVEAVDARLQRTVIERTLMLRHRSAAVK